MSRLITNIRYLVNTRENNALLRKEQLAELPVIENAYLIIDEGRITSYGRMEDLKNKDDYFNDHYDAEGCTVLPSWCDSHTHLVFDGSRENEFVDKIKGMSYADIAARGGGILNSARRLRQASEEALFTQAASRLKDVILGGTGAIEIKSGYGLDLASELKMLRVIRTLKEKSPIPVKSTFLGAHSFPEEYKENRQGYVDLVVNEMIPAVAGESLADYIDVFCEEGFFSPADTEKICNAGIKYGMKPKIHANQLNLSGGVQTGVKLGAVSVDHLETMDADAINALAQSSTIGTLLPTAAFFLRMQYQPARQLIDAGAAIALASDYNPGSSPSGNMNFVVALACIQMKMLPAEAINAATINAAHAMELQNDLGSISKGKIANLILTKPISSIEFLPYSFGTNLIKRVMVNGEWMGEDCGGLN